MGEAKRRKFLDPDYGKSKPILYIAPSPITARNGIYLQVRSHHELISTHNKRSGAEHGLKKCQECLDSLPEPYWEKPFGEAFSAFIDKINTPPFDYKCESEQVPAEKIFAWLYDQ